MQITLQSDRARAPGCGQIQVRLSNFLDHSLDKLLFLYVVVATIEMLLLQEPDYNYGWSIEISECKIEVEQRNTNLEF